MTVIAVIPARMAASRFPDKPLADLHGIPMVMHCYFRALRSARIDEVVIATCDASIADAALHFGAKAIMTSDGHSNAVDRTTEAMEIYAREIGADPEVVVLVQGDEPLLDPPCLDQLVEVLLGDPALDIVNAMTPFSSFEDFMDPNCCKVVTDTHGNALYMSREPIPSPWKSWRSDASHMQTGLIAFRPESLRWFSSHPRLELEEAESIDMVRVLHAGRSVRMHRVARPSLGVDTPSDLERARIELHDDELFQEYRHIGSA